MNNTNHFISGDNKGTAAYLFEKKMNGADNLPGKGPFLALFGQVLDSFSFPYLLPLLIFSLLLL